MKRKRNEREKRKEKNYTNEGAKVSSVRNSAGTDNSVFLLFFSHMCSYSYKKRSLYTYI